MEVIGSSNGLFCLTSGFDLYVLCNPCIQKAISIPHPNIGLRRFETETHSFGYSPNTDDYKVVRVVYVEGTTHSLLEIYTLRSGAWRSFTAPCPPYDFIIEPFGPISVCNIFFNGAVHWPARTPDFQHNFIVSFDMEDEVFREMAMPKSLQGGLGNRRECLKPLKHRKPLQLSSIFTWLLLLPSIIYFHSHPYLNFPN
jgi:F-box interacting protein